MLTQKVFKNLEALLFPHPQFHPLYFPIGNYSTTWKIPFPFLVCHSEHILLFRPWLYLFLLDLCPPSSSLSKSRGRLVMVPVSSFFSESRFVLLELSVLWINCFLSAELFFSLFLPFPNKNRLKYFSKDFLIAYLRIFFFERTRESCVSHVWHPVRLSCHLSHP